MTSTGAQKKIEGHSHVIFISACLATFLFLLKRIESIKLPLEAPNLWDFFRCLSTSPLNNTHTHIHTHTHAHTHTAHTYIYSLSPSLSPSPPLSLVSFFFKVSIYPINFSLAVDFAVRLLPRRPHGSRIAVIGDFSQRGLARLAPPAFFAAIPFFAKLPTQPPVPDANRMLSLARALYGAAEACGFGGLTKGPTKGCGELVISNFFLTHSSGCTIEFLFIEGGGEWTWLCRCYP